jgi:putative tryptophan/tyrosine transport system substrate-binding protein
MKRRAFIAGLAGAMAAPLIARAQQSMPTIGYLAIAPPDKGRMSAFQQGLAELGYVEGRNVAIEFRWADGRNDRFPGLAADLVRDKVSVIVAPGNTVAALAAKAATTTIPIVFGVGQDPVKLGLVASLGRPGGNATGVNFFSSELTAKRLGILRELIPGGRRFAVLVNPTSQSAAMMANEIEAAAGEVNQAVEIFQASTNQEIDLSLSNIADRKFGGLVITADPYFNSRRVQLALLTSRYAIPAISAAREYVEAGVLLSYGANLAETFHQVGIYAGRILKGAKPDDLPVLQSVKFELVLNLAAARAIGIDIPSALLATADEVIE